MLRIPHVVENHRGTKVLTRAYYRACGEVYRETCSLITCSETLLGKYLVETHLAGLFGWTHLRSHIADEPAVLQL